MKNKTEPRQRREMQGKSVCVLVVVHPFLVLGSGSCPSLSVNCPCWINQCSPFLINLATLGFLGMQSKALTNSYGRAEGVGGKGRLD